MHIDYTTIHEFLVMSHDRDIHVYLYKGLYGIYHEAQQDLFLVHIDTKITKSR